MGIFREIERMEKKDLRRTMDVYVELMAEQEPQPEIEQQLKLVVEYRHMLRNINKEHMKQQIKEELQIKILKQHEDRKHHEEHTGQYHEEHPGQYHEEHLGQRLTLGTWTGLTPTSVRNSQGPGRSAIGRSD